MPKPRKNRQNRQRRQDGKRQHPPHTDTEPSDIDFLDRPGDNEALRRRYISLVDLISSYTSAAAQAYKETIEATSIMLLTMMELWVEIDQYATAFYPMLLNFSTGFPPGILDSLVLPKREQLLRLARVEDHLENRMFAESSLGVPPWEWADANHMSPFSTTSFAAHHYENSPTLKSFHDQIKSRADELRKWKLEELANKRNKYNELLRRWPPSSPLEHERRMAHQHLWAPAPCKHDCKKCAFESAKEKLAIEPFLEPLPDDENAAKAIVFEIMVPEVVHRWRDATLLVHESLRSGKDKKEPAWQGCKFYYPENHGVIRHVLDNHGFGAGLLSPNGLFRVASPWLPLGSKESHDVKRVGIEIASEKTVIIRDNSSYVLCDPRSGNGTSNMMKPSNEVPTYSYAPSTVIEPWQSWISKNSHTPNEVIASLADCDPDLRFDEIKAFGSLRAGVLLQWPNILIQLAVPNLNFKEDETFQLIMQAANQAGPRTGSSPLRDAHFILEDEQFGIALIGKMRGALGKIQDNWEQQVSWAIFLCIAVRVLSLTRSPVVEAQCLQCLKEIRDKSIRWTRHLRKMMNEARDDESRKDLEQRTLTMALICFGTFDVGFAHLQSLFRESSCPEPAILLEASMVIAETVISQDLIDEAEIVLATLLYRWRRLSYDMEPLLRKKISAADANSDTCLDTAIRKIWPEYAGHDSKWSCAGRQHRHVLVSDSLSTGHKMQQRLQYNLLTGSFLVDSEPLSTLPKKYRYHKTYKRLFGKQIIKVLPSKLAGMRFQGNYLRHEVHFGMFNGDLIVRMYKDQKAYEFVPASKVEEYVPTLLSSEYTHWFVLKEVEGCESAALKSQQQDDKDEMKENEEANLAIPIAKEHIIEFRPSDKTWDALENRRTLILTISKTGSASLTNQDSQTIIDIQSPTAKTLARFFRPLEHSEFIHLTFDPRKLTLEIDLPRYQTGFTLRSRDTIIESNQYQNFIVDENQYLGTLVGLQTKMVLRSKHSIGQLAPARAVIVPAGLAWETCCVKERLGYASAWLLPSFSSEQRNVEHHFYHVKKRLGLLRGNSTLRSELFRCYLHAITSYVLPDPLTGFTGTETAFQILNSKAVRSLIRNSSGADHERDIKLLHKIATLSPRRTCAIGAGRSIQVVAWSDIPVLAQSDDFYLTVKSILAEARSTDVFFPGGRDYMILPENDTMTTAEKLHRRHSLRSPLTELRARPSSEHHDVDYRDRDECSESGIAEKVCVLTKLLSKPRRNTLTESISPSAVTEAAEILGCVISFDAALYVNSKEVSERDLDQDVWYRSKNIPLGFDVRWLRAPKATLRSSWTKIHKWLCGSNVLEEVSVEKYNIIMFLAAMSFARDANRNVIQLFLLFVLSPRALPTVPDYALTPEPKLTLAHGAVMDRTALVAQAEKSAIGDYGYGIHSTMNIEGPQDWWHRYERRLENYFERLADELVAQGLCDDPGIRNPEDYAAYVSMNSFMPAAKTLIRSWHANSLHFEYLERLVCAAQTFDIMDGLYKEPQGKLCLVPHVELNHEDSNENSNEATGMQSDEDPGEDSDKESSDGEGSDDEVGQMKRDLVRDCPPRGSEYISLPYLFEHLSVPEVQTLKPEAFNSYLSSPKMNRDNQIHPGMQDLLAVLQTQTKDGLLNRKHYVEELEESFRYFQGIQTGALHQPSAAAGLYLSDSAMKEALREDLQKHLENCEEAFEAMHAEIKKALTRMPGGSRPSDCVTDWYSLWPRITPTTLVSQLSAAHWKQLDKCGLRWKECLVEYAKTLTVLQRAERLVGLFNKDDMNGLAKEIKNIGHEQWRPIEFPDALLFEVENDLLIRSVQQSVAKQMANELGGNAVMQLNMGEGKSSVIVPIVAAWLANGQQLVRVIVMKPQFKQMMQSITTKLGGLLGRQVYILPFSRQLRPDKAQAKQMHTTYRQCLRDGGVLLVQLEHILSLKLLGLEAVITGEKEVGQIINNAQLEFDHLSRDIVDESDEIFNARFELTYTMGSQRSIQFSPKRWRLIQTVLEAGRATLSSLLAVEDPEALDVEAGLENCFPRIRHLSRAVSDRLLREVARQVCLGEHEGLSTISLQPDENQKAIFNYVTLPQPEPEDISTVERIYLSETDRQPLLLLRGLLACGVLEFVLCKRWRVNYGPHHNRDPKIRLSVPYRAKDSPAPRAEFSHPDTVIGFTCLSYYNAGLTDDELECTFEHLADSDQGEMEYQSWIRSIDRECSLPSSLEGVNIQDRAYCACTIFRHLRHHKGAVDYYLSNILFPAEMKEFPQKLSSSGWDLAGARGRPLTGFSGTKDSKSLLPYSINYRDLPDQQHTNASVLNYIFREENDILLIADHDAVKASPSTSTAEILLRTVAQSEPRIHVILDVGAQVLEYSNVEVARIWLDMLSQDDGNAKAVITFNDEDEMIVVERGREPELFKTTPYYEDTASCLVFLDEAHTRGTDLRLPDAYRAAVMLGPGLTKDKLVQACMRMRKLGSGQSVSFFVTDEVRQSINRAVSQPPSNVAITKVDLLRWTILETWLETERCIPLFAANGIRHLRQEDAWREAQSGPERDRKIDMQPEIAEKCMEDEALSLETRYSPSPRGKAVRKHIFGEDENIPATHYPEHRMMLKFIMRKCDDFGVTQIDSASFQDEQERELSPEVEGQREVEPRPQMSPLTHFVHQNVRKFVCEGVIDDLDGFIPAFSAFQNTSLAHLVKLDEFPSDMILVTEDFARTVEPGIGYVSDQYHRPVQWIVTKSVKETSGRTAMIERLVVFSAWEVNELLYLVEEHRAVTIHVYAPRPNLSCDSLEDLALYTNPPLPKGWKAPKELVRLLNIFAGQLFFRSHDEYLKSCKFLGLEHGSTLQGGAEMKFGPDRFVGTTTVTPLCPFTQSPAPFLDFLMSKVCRDNRDIRETHLGRILTGRTLTEKDFDGRSVDWDEEDVDHGRFNEFQTVGIDAPRQGIAVFDIRMPRSFDQIFAQPYLNFPIAEASSVSETRSESEPEAETEPKPKFRAQNDYAMVPKAEGGGRIVGETEWLAVVPTTELSNSRLFPEDFKSIRSFTISGCAFCGQDYVKRSEGTDGVRWVLNLGQLRARAENCDSCSMLFEAAKYMDAARIDDSSCLQDGSALELHYPRGTMNRPLMQILARWIYGGGSEASRRGATYEIYRIKSRHEEQMTSQLDVEWHLERPWIGVVTRSHTGGVQDVEAAITWTKKQLAECERRDKCVSSTEAMSDIFLPTRVLDLGEPGQIPLDADVRLYETGGNIQGMYMTLSHCWGGALPIMTLSGNLEAHKQKVSWEKLPRTFRDAIRVTRRLAVRYLWIDSLCIIQDDKNDWLVEAARMGRVYQESYLTIAATAAPNGDGGLFPSSSAPAKTRFHELKPSSTGQQGQDVDESSMFLRRQLNHDAFSTFSPDGPRLLTRGWVYQERVLSQRVIHFSDDELLWECRGRFACECGSAQARTSQIATVKQGQADGRAGSTWRVGYSAANSAGYNFDDHVAHNTGEAVHRPKRYRAMVSDYTRLHLTFARDRLPAFAGIARLYGGAGRGDYVAGLWTGSLASDLLWEVAKPSQRPSYGDVSEGGTDDYVAPTWSWASAQGMVPFYNLQLACQDDPPAFDIVAAMCRTQGPDEFGPCISGFLVVEGLVRDVRLETRATNEAAGRTFVAVKGEHGAFAKLSLDFEPDWPVDVAGARAEEVDDKVEDADDDEENAEDDEENAEDEADGPHDQESSNKPFDTSARTLKQKVIGECPHVYQCFYLTGRTALLLKQLTPGTSVYARVGVFFEFEDLKPEGILQKKTLKIV